MNVDGLQRFIPFRKSDVVKMCMADGGLPDTEVSKFENFCRLLESVFHFEFLTVTETLKECYAPFNPNPDTRSLQTVSETDKHTLQKRLVEELSNVLNAANYRQVTRADIEAALNEESLFNIRLEVDFDEFEDVLIFRRGENTRTETLVKFGGLSKQQLQFTNYERVALYLKYKDQAYFDAKGRKQLAFMPGSTIIKLFHNVPKADLEMLFPNSEVRMKTVDKLIIGVPAAVSGGIVLVSKLGASLLLLFSVTAFYLNLSEKEVQINQRHLVALGAGMGTLGAFVVKQYNKFKNRKIKFMKALSDNLYFKNLDNNVGVFHHLVDAAEEEEFKEAVLAYYFLLLAAPEKLDTKTLDRRIEAWFKEKYDVRLDFEIDDAMQKLVRLNLVEEVGGTVGARPLDQALRALDKTWDNYFPYND